MAGALDGITVLDLSHGMAGAMATMSLRDHGARVILIEMPGSEALRAGPGYKMWDRGKESIILDLATALVGNKAASSGPLELETASEQARSFYKLVQGADVLVESFSPSSRYQALVSNEKLAAWNPRLVSCSITGYGHWGPLKDEPPLDDLVMARTGILADQPSHRPGPIHVIHPVPSVGAALLAAQGIVASLFSREKTGRGRRVETSLMAGALMFAPKVEGEKLKSRFFRTVPAGGGPFYSVFECADGQWIQLGCIHSGFVDLAAAVMGIAHVLSDPKYGHGRAPTSEEARRELFDMVAGVLITRPYQHWAECFEDADVPYALACTTDEAMDNPQVRFNGMVVEAQDPEVGAMTQMGVPIRLSVTPGTVIGPRAVHGQHTDQVLSRLPEGIPQPVDKSGAGTRPLDPPLHGVKVMEITNVLAGPNAGKMLTDLGAESIKLESLDGDISRSSGRQYFYYLNANKRSVSLNTRSPEGKEIAQKLAAQSDVLLANLRPGATDRMGLGAEVLQNINPSLIEVHITAFGRDGPYAHKPGLDPLAQALMGLLRAQGGVDNPPMLLMMLGPTDYTGGALAALGALLALYARERTGVAQRVDTNLLNGGIVMSSDAFLRYEDRPPRRLSDKGQYGLGALHRLYETSDGWMYLVAESEQEWLALCHAIGLEELPGDPRFESPELRRVNGAALAHQLERVFREGTTECLLGELERAQVPFAPVIEGYDQGFFSDQQAIANDMIVMRQHPNLGRLKLGRNAIRFANTADIDARRTPLLGEHTTEVLYDLGYSDHQVEELYRKGVVKTEQALAHAT